MEEVVALNKERDEARLSVLEFDTDQECKDEYIDHLAFLLEPHLDLLSTMVADEICIMSDKIGVDITPTDR